MLLVLYMVTQKKKRQVVLIWDGERNFPRDFPIISHTK